MKSNFTEEYEAVRAALIRARKNQQLTQAAVAEQLLKPQSFVSKYESGERRLDIVEFCTIANILGMDVNEVLKETGLSQTTTAY